MVYPGNRPNTFYVSFQNKIRNGKHTIHQYLFISLHMFNNVTIAAETQSNYISARKLIQTQIGLLLKMGFIKIIVI